MEESLATRDTHFFLGWIIGGFLTFKRLCAPDSVLPVALLAAGGVSVALVAIIFYLRPQRIPITTAIGVALFTAVIGIFMLLEFFVFFR